jgi:hypothetical protein
MSSRKRYGVLLAGAVMTYCSQSRLPLHRRLAKALILTAALALPSCVFKVPLIDPEAAEPDPRLFGAWKAVPDKEAISRREILVIGKSGHPLAAPLGVMKAVTVAYDDAGTPAEPTTQYFFSARLGTANYAHFWDGHDRSNKRLKLYDPTGRDFCLLKYVVGNDRLTVWMVDPEAVEAAISRGQIKGTIRQASGWVKTRIPEVTEPKEGLARFLANGGDQALFGKHQGLVYIRIR